MTPPQVEQFNKLVAKGSTPHQALWQMRQFEIARIQEIMARGPAAQSLDRTVADLTYATARLVLVMAKQQQQSP